MRRFGILMALPLLGAAAPKPPAVAPPFPNRAECKLATPAGQPGRAQFRRLGELPPADVYAAVYRSDEKGCPDPLLYRDR